MHCFDEYVLQYHNIHQQTKAMVADLGVMWPASQQLDGELGTLSQAVIHCQSTNILRHVLYFNAVACISGIL